MQRLFSLMLHWSCAQAPIHSNSTLKILVQTVQIHYKGGGPKDSINRAVPGYEKDYPEPYRWRTMPSYGFFIRHVKNLRMHDIQTRFMNEEPRPAFILDDVRDAVLRELSLQKGAAAAYFMLKNVKDIRISNSDGMKDVNVKTGNKIINQ